MASAMKKLGIEPKERFGKIRLSEVFISVQGEGPRTGEPTTFFRTAGCNVRCPGWGVKTTLPNGEVVTGCDSPHSVFPEIYKQPGMSTTLSPEEAAERVPDYPKNICLTGGEPLLQAKSLTPWVESMVQSGHTIEVFTNGTVEVPDKLDKIWLHPNVTYVMDYKPKWSGVTLPFKEENYAKLREEDSIKFVCRNREDYEEAKSVISEHLEFKGTWFIGAVLGAILPSQLVEWMIEDELENVHLNLQAQAFLGMDVEPVKQGEVTFDETERTMKKLV